MSRAGDHPTTGICSWHIWGQYPIVLLVELGLDRKELLVGEEDPFVAASTESAQQSLAFFQPGALHLFIKVVSPLNLVRKKIQLVLDDTADSLCRYRCILPFFSSSALDFDGFDCE